MICAALIELHRRIGGRFAYYDVGARGANPSAWADLGEQLLYLGFEPETAECDRLNRDCAERPQRWAQQYYPVALAGSTGEHPFYLTKEPACASLLPPNPEVVHSLGLDDLFEVVKKLALPAMTLDDWRNASQGPAPDFFKIDIQGAELSVFQGGKETLRECAGIESEVEFVELYQGQPRFSELELFLRGEGFDLVDLTKKYGAVGASDRFDGSRGILVWGDALFLRHPRRWLKIAPGNEKANLRKAVHLLLICEARGLYDLGLSHARCVLNEMPGAISPEGSALLEAAVESWRRERQLALDARTFPMKLLAPLIRSRFGLSMLRRAWKTFSLHASSVRRARDRRVWPENHLERFLSDPKE